MKHNKTSSLLPILTVFFCAASATTIVEPLSDPQGWNGDFMRGARATASCPTDTIANARTRMLVHGPFTIEQYEQRVALIFTTAEEPEREQVEYKKVSKFVRENIGDRDAIYDVSFLTEPSGGNFWGFSGYVIARDDCVIHVGRMAYTN